MIGINISSNRCELGNKIDSGLALIGYNLDYNTPLCEVSKEDIYQIGRIMLPYHNPHKVFYKEDIISHMEKLIQKYSGE